MNKAQLLICLCRIPFAGSILRWLARRYPERSVVRIKSGCLAGYKWERSHKYLNGFWVGTFELPIQECLLSRLKPGDIFYDIGGNAGFFSLLGSKCVGDKGHAFVFEPLSPNAEMITRQLELNQISNCTLVEAAVSDRIGEIELYEGKDPHTPTIRPQADCQGNIHIVKTVTLDEFTKTAPSPDFIKMDIEGAEIMALRGAERTLQSNHPPEFIIEFHGEEQKKQGQMLLGKHGYSFLTLEGKKIESDSLPHHVLAVPASRMATE